MSYFECLTHPALFIPSSRPTINKTPSSLIRSAFSSALKKARSTPERVRDCEGWSNSADSEGVSVKWVMKDSVRVRWEAMRCLEKI